MCCFRLLHCCCCSIWICLGGMLLVTHGISYLSGSSQTQACCGTEESISWVLQEELKSPGSLLLLSIQLAKNRSSAVNSLTLECCKACSQAKRLFPTADKCFHCVYMCVYQLLNNTQKSAHSYVKYLKSKSISKFDQHMKHSVAVLRNNSTDSLPTASNNVSTISINEQAFIAVYE